MSYPARCCEEASFNRVRTCVVCGTSLCEGHSVRRLSDHCYVCTGEHRQPPFTFTCGRCGQEFHELPRGADGLPPAFGPPPFGVYQRVRPLMEPPDPEHPRYCDACASERPCTWWRWP